MSDSKAVLHCIKNFKRLYKELVENCVKVDQAKDIY